MAALKETAAAITAAKSEFYGKVSGMADAFEAEARAAGADPTRTEEWVRGRVAEIARGYEEARLSEAEAAEARVSALYDRALAEAASVFAKLPDQGEAAYLQAFSMRTRVAETDVRQAEAALAGNVAATAAMYDHARAHGVEHPGAVPSYLRIEELHDRCMAEAALALRRFGAVSVSGGGSAFSVPNRIWMALAEKEPGDEFTAALARVAAFE